MLVEIRFFIVVEFRMLGEVANSISQLFAAAPIVLLNAECSCSGESEVTIAVAVRSATIIAKAALVLLCFCDRIECRFNDAAHVFKL